MIVSVNNVHKSYGKEKVLKGISFTIEEPQIIALVGPNGSGKSTLMNIMTNLLTADEGDITILGKDNKDPNIFREVSFMQDNSVLYDYLTGYDHLQFIGDVQNLSKEKIISVAERIGIDGYMHKKVGNYSLGMKQHLLLTMALVNDPKLLILDEPLNGLDPTSAIKVRHLFLELYEQGKTILLSSHNLGEIDRVTSEILFLKDGTLIKEDISKYDQLCYELTVTKPEQALGVLKEKQLRVKKSNDKILIYPDQTIVHSVFELLAKHQITIIDIDKKIVGSEDRYQTIFAKKDVS